MRNLFDIDMHQYRRIDLEMRAHGAMGDAGNRYFVVPRDGVDLRVIASSGGGWDHVSVSTETRCPTWEEMEHIRKLFTKPGEVWLQFGVPEKQHINVHPYCLHWWRHQHRELRMPPAFMVA